VLARAFLLAGAQSMVTTLWAVSDSVLMALIRRFYENLSAGQDVAEALTRSKRAVVPGPDTPSAFEQRVNRALVRWGPQSPRVLPQVGAARAGEVCDQPHLCGARDA